MTKNPGRGTCARYDCTTRSGDEPLCDQHWVEAKLIARGMEPELAQAGGRGEPLPGGLIASRLTQNADGSPLGVETVLSAKFTVTYRRAKPSDQIEVYDLAPDAVYDPQTGEKLR